MEKITARDESRAPYDAKRADSQQHIIDAALEILAGRMRQPGHCLNSPTAVKDYLRLSLAELEHEEFGVLWLDTQNRLIADARLFRGTLTQTSVYPRELIKDALRINAGACILYHNHPSGVCEPSVADERLTKDIKAALAMVDCKTLDHIIVGGMDTASFAERGLI